MDMMCTHFEELSHCYPYIRYYIRNFLFAALKVTIIIVYKDCNMARRHVSKYIS